MNNWTFKEIADKRVELCPMPEVEAPTSNNGNPFYARFFGGSFDVM
jgi:hypothetical protein